MTDHKTGTREQWLTARLELLEAEKALTRRSDELARRQQSGPGCWKSAQPQDRRRTPALWGKLQPYGASSR